MKRITLLASVLILMLSITTVFAQKEEKLDIKFKDYKVEVEGVLYLNTTCKKNAFTVVEPHTYSNMDGDKLFVTKPKTYATQKNVYNASTKTWSFQDDVGTYFEIEIIGSGQTFYTTLLVKKLIQKMYQANLIVDGVIDEEALSLFILENGEEEPRDIY